ncbi:hypothetical protein [Streptomyces sp. enrichment culture]|uniref:hypothetical protein n=1 Tax=Streptomyces sp. enrichment culture TaxID=1795815 RepID=UPI003F55CB4B
MTVQHVDPRASSLRLALPLALLGPAFFLSSYMLSVGWDVPSGCRAAVVGLAVTLTAWLGSSEWLTSHPPGRRTGHGTGATLAVATLPCAALVTLSVALLHRGDSAGVWAVIPVIVLVQASVLLRSTRPASDPVSSGSGHGDGLPDRAAQADMPRGRTPATEDTTVDRPASRRQDSPAPTPPTGSEPPVAETDPDPVEHGTPVGPVPDPVPTDLVKDPPGREHGPAPYTGTVPLPDRLETQNPEDGPTPHRDREPDRTPRPPQVGIDAELWHNLAEALTEPAERREEQGGVALTARTDDGLWTIVGAVLPRQTWASAVRCEFSVLEVERVRDALDSLGPGYQNLVKITWLHTHPGLSVFLSATDHTTSASWRTLDPDFRPVVVDVTQEKLDDRIGVFDAQGKALRVGLVDGVLPAEKAGIIRNAVLERYRRTGDPLPLVLVGAEPYRT